MREIRSSGSTRGEGGVGFFFLFLPPLLYSRALLARRISSPFLGLRRNLKG
jgi:hypothetical protein